MKRLVLLACSTAVVFAQTGFDKKLDADRQAVHVLNRLTFGARPGDVDEVKKLGVKKWIERQMHPESIAENPGLAAKLQPLETLRLTPEDILKDYPATPPALRFQNFNVPQELGQDKYRLLTQGTLEERKAVLDGLDPEKRWKTLANSAPFFAAFPELKKEADAARTKDQEDRQAQIRKANPTPLDLLTQDQYQTVIRGGREQIKALFEFFDPEKRKQLASALAIMPQVLADFPELRREGMKTRQPAQVVLSDLHEGKVYRAVYSNRQLEEVLVDFWFNHFNVYEQKAQDRYLLASYEREAIRPHVLGKFKDLLLATARHPAMLYYLDNFQSMGATSFDVGPFANQAAAFARQAHGLNENYGRELMELHTLGVDGGYTQQDVIEVARCFTGWTIKTPNANPEFTFSGFMHDWGEKTVLGHKIPANQSGETDALQVIDILANHPSTAKFISKKLAQRFVADQPPQALVDRMAKTFTATGGDLRAVLQAMFDSPEFFSEGAWLAKTKSPLEFAASAVRGLAAEVTDPAGLVQKIADLGEPLYGKIEPTGYSNNGDGWVNTASLLGRMNFVTTLASGTLPGIKLEGSPFEGKSAAEIAKAVLGVEPAASTLQVVDETSKGTNQSPRYIASLVLDTPEFQRR